MTCCNAGRVGSLTRDVAAPGAYPHTRIPFLLRWERRGQAPRLYRLRACYRRTLKGEAAAPRGRVSERSAQHWDWFHQRLSHPTACVGKDTVRLFLSRDSQAQRGKVVFPESPSPSLTLSHAVSHFFFFSEVDWKMRRFFNFL